MNIELQWYNIYPYFFAFATQLLSTPVTSLNLCNQAPLITELRLLQATVFSIQEYSNFTGVCAESSVASG